MEKRLFILLSILLGVGFLLWYTIVDRSQQNELQSLNRQLEVLSGKVRKARMAQMNMKIMEKKFEAEKRKLEHVKTRFISRNDLTEVTDTLKVFSKKYHLELMDFAPAFDEYFSDTKEKKISTLPISITVEGSYLRIGRFLENWPKLPFYLVAEEVTLERTEKQSNTLSAQINASLYTWNE